MARFTLLPMPGQEQEVQDTDQNNASEGRFTLLPMEVDAQQEKPQEERSFGEKAGRVVGQFGLGALETATLPYDIAVAPLAQKEAQTVEYKKNVMDDIERLQELKNLGIADEKDEALLQNLIDQIKNPSKADQFVQTGDFSTAKLIEKATGIDTSPQNFAEEAARITGFIKSGRGSPILSEYGMSPKNILKNILPTGTEVARGVGFTAGLEMAKDGEFGPIGTLGAAIAGDLIGGGLAKAGKGALKAISNPKQALAEVAAAFTSKDKLDVQKQIIEDFRKNGITADLGTLTDSNLIKSVQTKLAQSGLTGKALDNLKESIVSDIRESYGKVAKEVGEMRFQTEYEAGQLGKDLIESIRKDDLDLARRMYKTAAEELKAGESIGAGRIEGTLQELRNSLSPGTLKSEGQKKVLNILDQVATDIKEGRILVEDAINTKRALNEIIDWEVQGGQKQLLKRLVADLDRSIISHGGQNPKFANAYVAANKRFAGHAKNFRNKEISRLLKEQDPTKLLNRMNSVEGMRSLEKIYNQTKEGKDVFKALKRKKLEQLFENSYVSNLENQLKFGTFANALNKPKAQEIAKEILGKGNFEKIKKIQMNAGRLADSANKFYNASQSGVVAVDAAIYARFLNSIFHALSGNFWGLSKDVAGLAAGKKIAGLMGDPEFLRAVEDVILANKKGSISEIIKSVLSLKPYVKYVYDEDLQDVTMSEAIESVLS